MKNKDIKQTIKEHFFANPSSKLRVREIERTLKLPLPSVIRYCKELEKEDILTTIKTGSVKFYTANRGDRDFLIEKKLFNLKTLYKSELIEYLKTELSNPTIMLFGSFSKGEDTEESDIDLYIETPSTKKPDLMKFQNILHRKIQLFQHKNIKEIENQNLTNNILNGIILNSKLEVFMAKEACWDDCLSSQSARSITPDFDRAKSLTETAQARISLVVGINEKNCNFVFEDYYTSLLELLQAMTFKKGYNIMNHICLGFYLRDVLKRGDLYDLFDDVRYKRNSLTYYGNRMDFETAKQAIETCKRIIKEAQQYA